MSLDAVNDETARALRLAWFRFVDTVEAHRADLHRYSLRLTGNVWSAEDLVQDTLLRGFAAIGRGDLHGEASRVRNARAYLFRTASNLWIDQVRRAGLESSLEADPAPAAVSAEAAAGVRDAGARLFAAAPQERAALVLKDVFDFSLREIAEMLDTTEGAVKAALHRGRAKTAGSALPARHIPPSPALLDRFVAAFNARDAAALTACLLDTVSIEVQGVGGGRGDKGVWVESSLRYARGRVEVRQVGGEAVILHVSEEDGVTTLDYVTRLEEEDGAIARVQSYSYCPETIAAVAAELGLAARQVAYHQPPETLERMIATTGLPWEG